MLTGRDQPQWNVDGPPHYPELGSLVNFAQQQRRSDMPNFVVAGKRIFRRGYASLGPAFAPLVVGADENNPSDFQVRNLSMLPRVSDSLEDRRRLLRDFDRLRRDVDNSGAMDSIDRFNQQALSVLTSQKLRKAFDLTDEPAKLK